MKRIFQKIIFVSLIVLILPVLFGCSDDSQNDIPTIPDIPEDTTEVPVWEVRIERADDVLLGDYTDIAITMSLDSIPIGCFDFLIAYEAPALTLADVQVGEFLESCGWEYFTYRYGAQGNCDDCPTGLVRLTGYAETNNGAHHPDYECLARAHNSEIAVITFLVSNERQYECTIHPISFFWYDCNYNSMFTIDGDTMAINRKIYDHNDSLINDYASGIPDYKGVPDSCTQDPRWTTIRYVDFHNGYIDIVCSDSIDSRGDRGDINCNGLNFEIVDAVIFSRYFLYGLSVFGSHAECSIDASDVNHDDITLTLADFVYLVRCIQGDALPYPYPPPAVIADVYYQNGTVGVSSSGNLGAALFVFQTDGSSNAPVLLADDMDIKYEETGNELRVLIYNIGSEYIPAGPRLVLTVDSNALLISAELATYEGGMVQTTIHIQ